MKPPRSFHRLTSISVALAVCTGLTAAVNPASAAASPAAASPAAAAPQGPLGVSHSPAAVAAPTAAGAAADVLPITKTCSTALRIRAQAMTAAQLTATCQSLAGQDSYFHNIVKDTGPVPGDYNTSLEVVVFNSRNDYVQYSPGLFGNSTGNGGVYLEGNPSASGNQARFIAYREDSGSTFQVKNLNHEYTHYLDGRFDMYGDYAANVSRPTTWWIEGFAEYVGYSYRKVFNSAAATAASQRTYALSTLFATTPSNDQTRVYTWGYLAVWYLLERHPADVTKILGYFRAGNWTAAYNYTRTTIGTRYDSDWYQWLTT